MHYCMRHQSGASTRLLWLCTCSRRAVYIQCFVCEKPEHLTLRRRALAQRTSQVNAKLQTLICTGNALGLCSCQGTCEPANPGRQAGMHAWLARVSGDTDRVKELVRPE